MAKIILLIAVAAGTQELGTVAFTDVNGAPARVDGNFNQESSTGTSAVVADPRTPVDENGMPNVIVKCDAAEGTTTVSGYFDVDRGEGVKRLDADIVITTMGPEATAASFTSRGSEPLGAEA